MSGGSRAVAIAIAAAMSVASVAHAGPASKEGVKVEAGSLTTASRIGLLPVVLAAEGAPEVGDAEARLKARVREAFSDSTVTLVPLQAEQTGDATTPFCADAVCWQSMAHELEVTHFLVVVAEFEDPDYRVTLWLIDGESGARVGTVEEPCDLCGVSELGAAVGDMAATMRRELESAMVDPPRLSIDSVPQGATVELDGAVVGKTPLQLDTTAGRHQITLRHEGYVVERQALDLVAGIERQLDVPLRRQPAGPEIEPTRDGKGRALVIAGTAATLTGTMAAGGGLAMVLVHDRPIQRDCDGSNVDALGRCRYLHDTRGGGIALLVTGGALVATGVTLLVLGLRARKAGSTARLLPTGTGLALRF